MTAAAPTVTRPVGRCPVTRLVIRIRDLWSEPPPSSVRFQFRDRRPRYFPVRSRGGVGRRYACTPFRGQWHPCPYLGASKVGRMRAPPRDARTRCQDAPPRGRREGTAATLCPCSDSAGSASSCSPSPSSAAACSGGPPPSFDPTGRLHDRRPRPRRLPRSRGAGADELPGRAPGTLDSGRNCTVTNLGSLARLGHHRGPLRRRHLVVRGGAGGRPGGLPDARPDGRLPGRLLQRERARRRRGPRSSAASAPTIAGRPGRRLDTKTGERLQTVVVWPSAEPGRRQRGHHQ